MMNSDSFYIRKFGYTCPFCHKENSLFLDDLDFRFNGCQDEFINCYNCSHGFLVEVRYNKIARIDS